jgi:hypothetical protein
MAESEPSATLFTNRLYDKLKFLALVLLPAVGTLYFGLAGIWGLPAAEKVIGSIGVLDTFLGVVLHLSNTNYYKNGDNFAGTLHVTTDSPPQVLAEFNGDPADLPGKHSVELNVNKVEA